MESVDLQTRIDKKSLVISSLDDDSDERAYWLSQTPQMRLQALEQMRQILYGYHTAPRLQRVLTVTQLA